MKNNDVMTLFNPVCCFVYFVGAMVQGVLFRHPIYAALSVVLSLCYYFMIKKLSEPKFIVFLFMTFSIITFVNPLFNTYGKTVLFYWGSHRAYSFEALMFGAAIGAMLVSILCFANIFNNLMTSDKIVYLFGNISSSFSIMIMLVLRLIPHFKNRIAYIKEARAAIGKGFKGKTYKDKLKNGSEIISALTNWGFEGGLITADSMKARGYGSSKRTHYKRYGFRYYDKLVLFLELFLLMVIIVAACFNGMKADYYPYMSFTGFDDPFMMIGFIGCFIFMGIPIIYNIRSRIYGIFEK